MGVDCAGSDPLEDFFRERKKRHDHLEIDF